MTELKPCPFCGKTPELISDGEHVKHEACFPNICISVDKWNSRLGEPGRNCVNCVYLEPLYACDGDAGKGVCRLTGRVTPVLGPLTDGPCDRWGYKVLGGDRSPYQAYLDSVARVEKIVSDVRTMVEKLSGDDADRMDEAASRRLLHTRSHDENRVRVEVLSDWRFHLHALVPEMMWMDDGRLSTAFRYASVTPLSEEGYDRFGKVGRFIIKSAYTNSPYVSEGLARSCRLVSLGVAADILEHIHDYVSGWVVEEGCEDDEDGDDE